NFLFLHIQFHNDLPPFIWCGMFRIVYFSVCRSVCKIFLPGFSPSVLSSLVRSYRGVTSPEVIPLAAGHSIFKVQCLLTRTILPKKTAFSRICKRLEKSEKPPYFHAFGNVL
ncbi:MAG: hypothetical protein ACLUWE_09050, partial [Lachnospira sp.]